MGDYFAHWLAIGKKGGDKLPKLFYVNWFRKGANGRFLWPGYGENSRVLKWVFERCDGAAEAVDTPIGRLPSRKSFDMSGLDLPSGALDELLRVDVKGWIEELPSMKEHFAQFGAKLPKGLSDELAALEARLRKA
jgi:phosphoenolpyruvate carboxykinase (GTP)